MSKVSWTGKILICSLLLALAAAPLATAQNAGVLGGGPKPVMENIFFNVVWGSLFGMVLGAATAVIESDRKTSPTDIRSRTFGGATFGGLVGLGVGLWLVTSGVTFADSSTLFTEVRPDGFERPVAAASPPFALETSRGGSFRVTGFRATVFSLKF